MTAAIVFGSLRVLIEGLDASADSGNESGSADQPRAYRTGTARARTSAQIQRQEERLVNGEFILRPGAERVIRHAKAQGIALGLISDHHRNMVNAARAWIAIGPGPTFDAVLAAEDGATSGRAPKTYAEMLRRLGVEPRAAIALEDTSAGVDSAEAAGIETVALYLPLNRTDGTLPLEAQLEQGLQLWLKHKFAPSSDLLSGLSHPSARPQFGARHGA